MSLPQRKRRVSTHGQGDDVGLAITDEFGKVVCDPTHRQDPITQRIRPAEPGEIEGDASPHRRQRLHLIQPHPVIERKPVNEHRKGTLPSLMEGDRLPSDVSILHTTTLLSPPTRTISTMRKLLAAILLVLTACSAQQGTTVLRVIDGDTLIVRRGGEKIRVRLIGINAPEHDECYGSQATQALRHLVDGRTVTLVTDTEASDQYGRLLAYVYVDGKLANQSLVEDGFALARPYPPNTSLQPDLDRAMQRARRERAGMWAPSACGSKPSAIVDIGRISFNPPGPDGQHLDQETVTLRNNQESPIDLSGWTLRDGSSVHRFVFPAGFELLPGTGVTVHTGCGRDGSEDLHWCADGPIWNNEGDIVMLFDDSGALVSSITYSPR